MQDAVDFLVGLAIGAGVAAGYFFIRTRSGGENAARNHARFRQALITCGFFAVVGIIAELILRMR